MTDSLKTVRTRKTTPTRTAQTEKAEKGQVKNAAGGFTFKVDKWARAKRFLILGSEANYYRGGQEMSKEAAKVLVKLAEESTESSKQLVDLIVEVSTAGRAPKQNPGIFALAVTASHGTDEAKRYALSKLPEVARTGTTLFLFAGYVEQFRGWGRSLKRAVAEWYTDKDVDSLAFQAVKYQSREGWSHKDLAKLSHPARPEDAAFNALMKWIIDGEKVNVPRIVEGYLKAHEDGADVPAVIREYRLTWEMVPTAALNEVATWDALFAANLPLGALLRQLPRLTRIGFIKPLDDRTDALVKRLTDKAQVEKARIHPIAVLTAMKTYASGRSEKGSSTWTPDKHVLSALDKMFYLAFKNVVPAGKRTLIGLDVSGSMDGGWLTRQGGGLTPREATAAVALVTVSTEPKTHVIGFTGGARGGYGYSRRNNVTSAGSGEMGSVVTNLDAVVSPDRRLDDVIKDLQALPMGSTDCSLPMLYALEENIKVDTFIVMTDNETYAGSVHPHEALKRYREKTGINARLVVLATEATRNSIADPNDAGMLDIAAFDSAAPGLVADFSRGDI